MGREVRSHALRLAPYLLDSRSSESRVIASSKLHGIIPYARFSRYSETIRSTGSRKMQTTLACGMVFAIRSRAWVEAKYVGATSPASRSCVEVGKWALYHSSPRSKWLSKKRVSLVGEGKRVCLLKTSCSQLVPVRGGPTTKNDGSGNSSVARDPALTRRRPGPV